MYTVISDILSFGYESTHKPNTLHDLYNWILEPGFKLPIEILSQVLIRNSMVFGQEPGMHTARGRQDLFSTALMNRIFDNNNDNNVTQWMKP